MKSRDDTIVAIASAPGEGAIAVVRMSGAEAERIGAGVLRGPGDAPIALRPRGVQWARVVEPVSGRVVDEVLAVWMPGPGSYTREDVLELQCHGGYSAGRAVLGVLLQAGARLAEPGEFTLRAYLGGRIDLLQAEAVLDVIQAQTAEALRVHEGLLAGGLSAEVEGWQLALGRALAEIEARLDFPEEEMEELPGGGVRELVDGVAQAMGEKLETFRWGRTSREGFRVALLGAPNTGKSSLLNRLAGGEHAIVSAVPGTTRDVIEVRVNAVGVPVRLIDTAGLRSAGDEVEEEGVRRARRAGEEADLGVLVFDGSRELSPEEREEVVARLGRGNVLWVVNKADLGTVPTEALREMLGADPLHVSALKGEGIEGLLWAVREAAWGGRGPGPEAPLTRERQRLAVESARGCLVRAAEGLQGGHFEELVAREIQGAREVLRGLLGWGTAEDVLNAIFSEFCIGK